VVFVTFVVFVSNLNSAEVPLRGNEEARLDRP
jgi:hypothetical protein